MRKIFLHIGCGKTGTSAIQVWANNNAAAFLARNIHYPTFGARTLDAYAVTTGNGAPLVEAFRSGRAEEMLKKLIVDNERHLLFSSEVFQLFGHEELLRFRALLEEMQLEPVVIAYVRDVYDIVYSSYQQLVKRHFYDREFRDFVLEKTEIQQFSVLRDWSEVFRVINVFHYDSERKALDSSFCRALGISAEEMPRMAQRTVNRSLTLEETGFLLAVNGYLRQFFGDKASSLATTLSDAMLKEQPEASAPILYDQVSIDYISEAFSGDIDWVNERFFGGQKVLKTFDPTGKKIATSVPPLARGINAALAALMEQLNRYMASEPSRAGGGRLNPADPRVVDALREEAMRREAKSLSDALALMAAARVLRPGGQWIVQKVADYEARLKARENGIGRV